MIDTVIYPIQVMFSLNQKKKDLDVDVKKFFGSKFVSERYRCYNRGGITYYDGAKVYIVIRNPKTNYDLANSIAHEVQHCVRFILETKCGMPMTKDNDEAYAYLAGYITEQIYKTIL